jgi:hypothetical protein
MKGLEYIQAKFISLEVLSLKRKIFAGLNIVKDTAKKSKRRIKGDLGKKEAICSLEASVDT